MYKRTAAGLFGLAGALIFSSQQLLAASSYVPTIIPPVLGGFDTYGLAVNDAGVVVGRAINFNYEYVAFVYMNGVSTELPNLPNATYIDGEATGINNSNVIVGVSRDEFGISRAVKWTPDGLGGWTITDLGTLAPGNVGFGVATRINDAGQVVGYSSIEGLDGNPGPYNATLWEPDGTKVNLGTLSFSGDLAFSQALGINNAGKVTGFAYQTLGGPEHGLFYDPTNPPAVDITPTSMLFNGSLAQWHNVNSSNVLAGYVFDDDTMGRFTPATYSAQTGFIHLPVLPTTPEGYGWDINDNGLVVGTNFLLSSSPDFPSTFLAFVYENGVTSDLNTITTEPLPGVMTDAFDISNTGLIVGTYYTFDYSQVGAVLLTPVPTCAADFNHSGSVEVADIFAFLNAWFSQFNVCSGIGACTADLNNTGTVEVADIFAFLNAWFAEFGNCP